VQPQLLKVLRQVGYQSDDKSFADLSSPEHTMAKVFHYMLTCAVDRESLPWGQAGHYEADLDGESRLSALIEANSEGFGAAIGASVSSDACLSLVSKSDWSIGDAILVSYEQEDRIDDVRMNNAHLFLTLQCIMNDLHFDWFHPDDLRMIARTQASEYLVFEAEYTGREFMSLIVPMERGSGAAFRLISRKIKKVLEPKDPFLDDSLNAGTTEAIPE
jgi:hypothetical protein